MTIADQQVVDRPPPSALLHIETSDTGGVVDLRLIGEMDISTRGQLVQAVEQALFDGAIEVRLDLAGLDFCDASGLAELIAVRNKLAVHQRECAALSAQPSLLRLLTISGLVGLFALLPA